MDFLVTMTTTVPEGTSPADVDAMRAREAANSAGLAARGELLRLWRPPLGPGEWRTLGLFAAADAEGLEAVLATMPLRVWRHDEVTPLAPHPNDPGPPSAPRPGTAGAEFLVAFAPRTADGPPPEDGLAAEAARTAVLAREGHLLRLWRTPGEEHALGLWHAGDPAGMDAILASLPLIGRLSARTTPLSAHPSDPALAGS